MKILCPKCKGEGWLPDMIERVATLGVSWVFDQFDGGARLGWDKCKKCKGKGKIKI
jgi:DnaJ-class molecular chaperone